MSGEGRARCFDGHVWIRDLSGAFMQEKLQRIFEMFCANEVRVSKRTLKVAIPARAKLVSTFFQQGLTPVQEAVMSLPMTLVFVRE